MLLREHPLFRYHNIPSWPPVWTWTAGGKNDRPQGEIGILRKVELSRFNLPTGAFYTLSMKAHPISAVSYSMTLLFCCQVATLLQRHCNRPIAEIGSFIISHPL